MTVFFQQHARLTGWQERVQAFDRVDPWKPRALFHGEWPPDYRGVYAWRIETLAALNANDEILESAMAYYSTRPAEFMMHWMDTYNPRKRDNKWMPFVFFERQRQLIKFLHELRIDQENGLIEKCRDAGATWLVCGYSVWSWLFINDDAIGWGSRKQDLVDTSGDPDSIFQKMRLIIQRLPGCFLPEGLNARKHMTFMKLINPVNGSTVTGEAGDNIGRGGRKSCYYKDESAHYPRPEKVEAALGDNTNVQVDISSVNGLGNVFHRRRESGIEWQEGQRIQPGFTRVFVMDWRHHPEKTEEWYEERRAKAEREGMMHVFAQEVDRDYAASVGNTIIKYEWLQACIDAHIKVPYLAAIEIPDVWGAGLDVADEGIDRNALTTRQWIIWRTVDQWGERDPGVTARRTIDALSVHKRIQCQYDSIGIGASVKSEYNRLRESPDTSDRVKRVEMVPWNAGAEIIHKLENVIPGDEESLLNKDYFQNFKAQAWFSMRTRVYKTWKAVTAGAIYPADELISFDSSMPLLLTLLKELAQPVVKQSKDLLMIVDKAPSGTKSPDLADSGVMAFFPVPPDEDHAISGTYV